MPTPLGALHIYYICNQPSTEIEFHFRSFYNYTLQYYQMNFDYYLEKRNKISWVLFHQPSLNFCEKYTNAVGYKTKKFRRP